MAVRNQHTRQNCRYLIFEHGIGRFYLEIGNNSSRAALRRTRDRILKGRLTPPTYPNKTTLIVVHEKGKLEYGIV